MKVLDAALDYARRGWAVCPVDGKIPYPGTHGTKDATTDEATIKQWWAKHPAANVVVVAAPHLFVLDVDRHGQVDGMATLKLYAHQYGRLPRTPTSETGGGGLHILFAAPTKPFKTGPVADGLEVLNWFVAPPSLHGSGVRYRWVWPLEIPLAPVPPWLLELSTRPVPRFTTRESGTIYFRQGQRDTGLFNEACHLRGRGYPEEAIAAALLALNASCCSPPLVDTDVLKKAASAARYDPTRRVPESKIFSVEVPKLCNLK